MPTTKDEQNHIDALQARKLAYDLTFLRANDHRQAGTPFVSREKAEKFVDAQLVYYTAYNLLVVLLSTTPEKLREAIKNSAQVLEVKPNAND